VEAGLEAGLPVAHEGFPERGYTSNGTLMPRGQPGAVIESPDQAAAQALRLVRQGVAFSTFAGVQRVPVDTLCVHGDNPSAVQILRAIRALLSANGVGVAPLEPGTRSGA
jgi:UPF0271 protein